MRVAMIAYTPYEMDARVKRAAEALTDRGHHVDVFAAAQEGIERRQQPPPSYPSHPHAQAADSGQPVRA